MNNDLNLDMVVDSLVDTTEIGNTLEEAENRLINQVEEQIIKNKIDCETILIHYGVFEIMQNLKRVGIGFDLNPESVYMEFYKFQLEELNQKLADNYGIKYNYKIDSVEKLEDFTDKAFDVSGE